MNQPDITPAARQRAIALLEAADFLRTAHFRDGLTVQEIGAALLNTADDADPMAASLFRDGCGPDEIAAMLASVEPAVQSPADRAACNCEAEVHMGVGFYHHPWCSTRTANPTDQAAVRAEALREGADAAERLMDERYGPDCSYAIGGMDVARELRRLAGEPPASEARPPRHAWRVETRDPLADEWVAGSHFASRPHAVDRWETANRNAPKWRDGTPVQRRIVRETTTYTVEEPAPVAEPPAAADDEAVRRC